MHRLQAYWICQFLAIKRRTFAPPQTCVCAGSGCVSCVELREREVLLAMLPCKISSCASHFAAHTLNNTTSIASSSPPDSDPDGNPDGKIIQGFGVQQQEQWRKERTAVRAAAATNERTACLSVSSVSHPTSN